LIKPVILKPDSLMTFEEGLLLTYPLRDLEILKRRIEVIKRFGVDLIEFTGSKEVLGVNLLGKGTRSIVVKAWVSGYPYALKIRRLDSSIPNLKKEAENMKIANSVSVGPKLISYDDDVILMELIDGKPILDWMSNQKDPNAVRRVLLKLILDVYRLDMVCLDHGELSRASKHIFVKSNNEPVILDFGSSSVNRRPSNVSSLVSYLFIRNTLRNNLQNICGHTSKEEILEMLRNYKRKPSEETLKNLIETLNLNVN
jgi:putative serine/threonine protein kinase